MRGRARGSNVREGGGDLSLELESSFKRAPVFIIVLASTCPLSALKAAGTSDTRLFPYGLSASRGQGRGCDHQVVMAARGGGCNRLAVTGWVTGEDMVASIRFALAWARLHRGMIAKLFFGGGEASAGPATRADDDATRLLALDVYRRDLDFFVTVGGANARKHGASVRPRMG